MEKQNETLNYLHSMLIQIQSEQQSLNDKISTISNCILVINDATNSLSELTERQNFLNSKIEEITKAISLLQEKEEVEDVEICETPIETDNESTPKIDVVDAETFVVPIEDVADEQSQNVDIEEDIREWKPQGQPMEPLALEPKQVEIEEQSTQIRQQNQKEIHFDIEKFIGEKLFNIIGILILLIGVAIGGKYALDHDMISPAVRIALGYAIGAGIAGLAYKLKPSYEKFSAVLMSGASSIFYFMTFFAYEYYDLIPMPIAFLVMALITAFIVFMSHWYNREIISIIGQVGAYVIPFLLGKNTGHIWSLLLYVVLVNYGILIVSCRKYWKWLFVTAFVFSWLIFAICYKSIAYDTIGEPIVTLLLMMANFAVLLWTFLSYKIENKKFFEYFDVSFIILNALLFFGQGYGVMNTIAELLPFVSLFSLVNALIYGVLGYYISKKYSIDKSIIKLFVGLSIVFFTTAIALFFSGHWVTIFWMAEAALLFWIGRTRRIEFYERMSYPVVISAVLSLIADWGNPQATNFKPFEFIFNSFASVKNFMLNNPQSVDQAQFMPWVTTVIVILLATFMIFIENKYPSTLTEDNKSIFDCIWRKIIKFMTAVVVTTAILVHFDQPVITICWTIESLALLILARKNNSSFIENASNVIYVLTFISIITIWAKSDFLNIDVQWEFLSQWRSLLATTIFMGTTIAMIFINKKTKSSFYSNLINDAILNLLRISLFVSLFVFFAIHFQSEGFNIGIVISAVILFYIARILELVIYKFASWCFWSLFIILNPITMQLCDSSVPFLNFNFWFCMYCTVMLYMMQKIERAYPLDMHESVAYRYIFQILTISYFVAPILVNLLDIVIPDAMFIWIMLGLLVFFCSADFISQKRQWHITGNITFAASIAVLVLYTILSVFGEFLLNEEYVSKDLAQILHQCEVSGKCIINSIPPVILRCLILALSIFMIRNIIVRRKDLSHSLAIVVDIILTLVVVIVGSYEINNLLRLFNFNGSFDLMRSVYWGLCSLFMVYFGLFKNIKHLRIEGFVLIGFTLIKLFFYDLSHYGTLSKTIIFVVLGIFMLVCSFFYQKITKERIKENNAENDVENTYNENNIKGDG